MRCRPQCTRCVHHVAVILHFHDEPAVLTMRERRSNRSRWSMTESAAACAFDGAIVLINIPKRAGAACAGPILVFDHLPDFCLQSSGADGAGIPAICRVGAGTLDLPCLVFCQLPATLLKSSFAI